jgi:integrative and conjugative element protein (TIGR02256 family)
MNPTVVLPADLLDDLQRRRRMRLPFETGGFLLGKRRGRHLEVTSATDQAPDDVATWRSFERIDRSHGAAAISEWQSSGGVVAIIGDWHSHPYGPPHPSPADRKAWRQLCRAVRGPCLGIILADGNAGLYLIRANLVQTRVARLSLAEVTPRGMAFVAPAR